MTRDMARAFIVSDRTLGQPEPEPVKFTPTRFMWRHPSTIPPRQFVYGRHMTRGFLGVTLAPGGLGKSSLVLAESVAMASQRPLLGIQTPKPRRVWYVNLEDPRVEVERRIAAICLHYAVKPEEIEDRLFFDGREIEIITASQTKTGAVISTPIVEALKSTLVAGGFDALIVDPFISSHRVSENDNPAIDAIAKTLGRIAGETNSAIELVHHVRKTGGAEITIEDGRGASALIDASRSARVLNRMTEKEAEAAGVGDQRKFHFRVDSGKATLAPPVSKASWFRLENVDLGNAVGDDNQDQVGVVTPWKWPDAFEGVTISDFDRVKARIREGRWRENNQAKDWAGIAVAEVLALDISQKGDRARIAAMLKTWIKNGALVVVDGEDDKRRQRKFIEAGDSDGD
jgi:hypothetical protein